jgi:poly-gamma-glutamate synthesis protein (capsule biosynthesis protein)
MTESDVSGSIKLVLYRAISYLLLLVGFNSGTCIAQLSEERKLTLLFIGDIMGHDEQIWSAENRKTNTFNYDTVFTFIRPEIMEADIAIANFEVPMGGIPYTGYPAFSSPSALAVACKNAGIDCLVTANNHAADRREYGIKNTLHILDSLDIAHAGTFYDSEERKKKTPLIIEKNGITIALLNYTYGTNGISVNNPVIVNTIDKNVIERDLAATRYLQPDITAVFLHWGNEYDTVPSQRQYEIEKFLYDNGADLIIGSHPHVLQKMEWQKSSGGSHGRATVYSLGNFVSNQRKIKTDGGAMARIELTKKDNSTSVSDAEYYLTWVYTPIENYRKRFYIIPCSEYENKAAFFSDTLQYKKMKAFMSDSRHLLYKQNVSFYEIIYNGSSWLLNY